MRLAIDLASLPGQSGREEQVAAYILDYLKERPLRIIQDQAGPALGGKTGNLRIEAPGAPDMPRLLFCAHLDVSAAPSIPVLQDGRLFSPEGFFAADDRVGVCLLLALLEDMPALRGSVTLLFTVAEEQCLAGARLLPSALRDDYDFAFVLDCPGPPGAFIIQSDAGFEFQVRVFAEEDRGGNKGQADARWVANRILARLPIGELSPMARLEILSGATPPQATGAAFLGAAYAKDEASMRMILELLDVICRETVKRYGFLYSIHAGRAYPGYIHASSSAVVNLAAAAARHVLAKPLQLQSQFASDANILNLLGLPAVNLASAWHEGPRDEAWAYPDEMMQAVAYLRAIVALAATRPAWQRRRESDDPLAHG